MSTVPIALVLCALTLGAQVQYPGQYPPGQTPPGQTGRYPPGQGPGGGGGNNPPRQSRQTKQGRETNSPTIPTTTTTGMFRLSAGSQFVLEADDHRIITYRTSGKTTIQKDNKDADIAGFSTGDRLSVDSTEDDQGFFTAVSVRFEKAGTPGDHASASATWDLPRLDGATASASAPSIQREPGDDRPIIRRKAGDAPKNDAPKATAEPAAATVEPEEPADTRRATTLRPPDPAPDSDDPGPPSLRRGIPTPRPPAQQTASTGGIEPSNAPVILSAPPEAEPATVSASILSAGAGGDLVIEKAREVAGSFTDTLPDFFCQQLTTRYQSDHPKQGWDALDVVSADVAYKDGQETYKNIRVGNKPVNKAMEDIGGNYSTGEFSGQLEALLNPGNGAIFRRGGQDTVRGRATWVYKFEVPRDRSRWRVIAAGQLYYPAYRGTIWIDRQTSRVLRLEQQSRNMALLFPFDTVETSIDYDLVRLGGTQLFLLPVNAEVLTCLRGTSHCSRNRIEFRNYRKFGSETSVTFEDKP